MAEAIVGAVKRASGWSIALGVLMIILGFIAILAPWEFGIVIVLVVGWAAIFNGGAQLIYAFRTHSGGRAILEGILGLIYIVAGIYLLMHPAGGLLALTLLLACFLLVYGIVALVLAFHMRPLAWLGLDPGGCHRDHSPGYFNLGPLAVECRVGGGHIVRHQYHHVGGHSLDDLNGIPSHGGKCDVGTNQHLWHVALRGRGFTAPLSMGEGLQDFAYPTRNLGISSLEQCRMNRRDSG